MKEKVDRLSKGVFEFETPGILLSEEELVITVDAGKNYTGSFTVKNDKNTPIKGILYSSNELFRLEQNRFTERENEIQYTFYGENMSPLETVKGEVCIVSDCGEIILPFTVSIEAPYIDSSIGKIKDLFNFTNLARTDTAEAIKLFKSKEFKEILIHHDIKFLLLYQNIVKSRSISQAMEEFLIAIRKKIPVNISVDKTVLHYEIRNESMMDKITLIKDNWGYAKINVSTDALFLVPEHKIIWAENFVGNNYPLEFVLNPSAMRPGNNFGRIFLASPHGTITVEVCCHKNRAGTDKETEHKKIKQYRYKITHNYLEFRRNLLPLKDYVSDTEALLERLIALDGSNQDYYQLLRIHLLIISGEEMRAGENLQNYTETANCEKESTHCDKGSTHCDKGSTHCDKESNILLYCGYLYLKALLNKDEAAITEALNTIRGRYESGSRDWQLLWFLLYVDKKYDINKALKLEDIKEQYKNGCRSPILYFEAAVIFNEEPSLLHELQEFEFQVLNWSIKNEYIMEEAAMQYTYLAGKKKFFSRTVHHCLEKLYPKYGNKEILTAICSHLIKGQQRSGRYFTWYREGVEEQLRITELYEYYMYSVNENPDTVLPQQILLYFIYNSSLNDRKKAYLYAYIVKRKESLPAMYRSYLKRIEQFVVRQLTAHNMNANLALLYEEILATQPMTPEIAAELPFVMFKHEIVCNNPNMKGVLVVHKEMREEVFTPFSSGTAYVDIYTEDAEIFLVDGTDNRYAATAEYILNKLMHWEYYINTCYDMKVKHPMVLLNLSEKVQTYQKFDPQSIEIRKQILDIPGLDDSYYNKINLDLVSYYYDNFEGELLENYLHRIEVGGLNKADRDKIIELFIIRDLYDKALKALTEFGFQGVAVKRLIKLCSALLQRNGIDEENNGILVSLAYHIFREGKYNEEILDYLVKNFFGTTGEMYDLWLAASGFEMETGSLEERLLGQMLFAESYITNSLAVFLSYYKKGTNHKLIRAFLTYNAYKYLVMDRVIQPELFPIMKRQLTYEENEVCMLALLKQLSQEDSLGDGEKELVDYNLHKMIQKGIILPFFKKFQNSITLPSRINDRIFVEYITNPSHKVTIHYRLEGKDGTDDFTTEEMNNVYLGIHVKEFILFYNENIQYYITEEEEEGQLAITESVNVQLDHNMKLEEDTRYNQLNFMLTALDVQDDKTLMESISNYYKLNYVTDKLFHLL